VASRRLTDLLRSEQARKEREWHAPPPSLAATAHDDSLIVLFMCCHPALAADAQIALTLRAVGGLTTRQIARAFLIPEDTMTRRITRAKRRIKDSGIPFSMPAPAQYPQRRGAVLHVLYLVFTEGYAATRADLTTEAIRLARLTSRLLPGDNEAAGLLALMLLTEARRAARTGPADEPIPMADQDRSRWNTSMIAEGVALVTSALSAGPAGPYQLQAAISALHDEAPTAAATDWPQIAELYSVLLRLQPDNPVIRLNHAVAIAMAHGPQAGLALLSDLDGDPRLATDHRLPAARAHLLELAGSPTAARTAYLTAAGRALTLPQRRYLLARAEALLLRTAGGSRDQHPRPQRATAR
jgi:predicted RNA polymerase sigma factor